MQFFRWSPAADEDSTGQPFLNFSVDELHFPTGIKWWDVVAGRSIENWDSNTVAEFDESIEPTDFPLVSYLIPIHSERLRHLMHGIGIRKIQYLPLCLRGQQTGKELQGYCIANYLSVVDCLDRKRSTYETWTKENLLFWEKRPTMLGTFRYVHNMILDRQKVASEQVFRLWGCSTVIVREDVRNTIEAAGITGCVFWRVNTN